jgi:hypothetical protein
MKVKIFILTWKDAVALNNNLRSLFKGFTHLHKVSEMNIEVIIINNHTEFSIDPLYEPHVRVIHNAGQPDFATAMIARMWNLAIIHGFKSLNSPDCDVVITSQDDAVWQEDWVQRLEAIRYNFDFYADDAGDLICMHTPTSVKKIGMWDERFHYGFGEGDYFLRAVKYMPERSSINDYAHGRVWNPSLHLAIRPEPDPNRYAEQSRSHRFRGLSWANFLYKWKTQELEGKWPRDVREKVLTIEPVPSTIHYPYFELDIEDLKGKGYIL